MTMHSPATVLYAGLTATGAAVLVDERIRDERAALNAARDAAADAYRRMHINDLVEGRGMFAEHGVSPASLRHDANLVQRTLRELELMRLSLNSLDPVRALRRFAAETPNQLLSCDASAMAQAMARGH